MEIKGFSKNKDLYKYLLFLIKNILFVLSFIFILHLFKIVNINHTISARTLLLSLIYTLFLLNYLAFKKKKAVNLLLKFLFPLLLILTLINSVTTIKELLPFLQDNLEVYLNHLLFLTGISLMLFNKAVFTKQKKVKNKKDLLYILALILIAILFLAVHLSMFRYPGGHPDEFRHILAGKTLAEEGTFPVLNNAFNGRGYLRGAPISFLIALFFYLFGFSARMAKLVPISLGFLTLLLLYRVSKYVIRDKLIRILSLLLFVLSPWLLFTHFYIRHYVFLEFSFVLTVFLFIKIIEDIKNKYNLVIYYSLLFLINLTNYFLTYDSTKFIMPFISLWGIIYLFTSKKINPKNKNKIIKNFLKLKKEKKFFIILIASAIIFLVSSIFIDYLSILNTLLRGKTNTVTGHYNFNTFFFGIYSFFTIFLMFGLFRNIFNKKKENTLIFLLVIPIMALHFLSSTSMQIMRVLVYLLPMFYILTCYGLEQILEVFKKKNFIKVFILITFSLISLSILRKDKEIIFLQGYPVFPLEIGYDEFEPMYDYVKENLDGYILIETAYSNQSGIVYDVITDYRLDLKKSQVCTYTMYYDQEDDICRHYYTDTSAIHDREEWNELIENNNVCVLLRSYAYNFLEDSDIRRIKRDFELKESFVGYDIYCKDL